MCRVAPSAPVDCRDTVTAGRWSTHRSPAPLVDKTPHRIAGMFDGIARRYDVLNHILSAGLDRRWRARAVRSLGLGGEELVVDLCTGTADLAIALTRGPAGASQVVGVDFAGEMLRRGQAKIADRGLAGRVRLVRGDVTRVPVGSESAHCATVAFGIRNVEDPRRALDEMHRLIRPGGRVAILEFGTPNVPVLRSVYAWYFQRVLPRLGAAISGHDSAYAYLPASVGEFGGRDALCGLLRAAGFIEIRAVPLQLGIVYLYEARRAQM